MEELEQKHLHLLQVVESEKTAKWQYTQHCEELTEEIKKLRNEVSGSGGKYTVRKESRETRLAIANTNYICEGCALHYKTPYGTKQRV